MHRAKISSNWVCKNHFWLLSIHFLSFCQHIQVWKLKLQVKIISSAFRWPPFLLEKESASPVCVYSRRRSLIPVQGLTKKWDDELIGRQERALHGGRSWSGRAHPVTSVAATVQCLSSSSGIPVRGRRRPKRPVKGFGPLQCPHRTRGLTLTICS